MLFFSLCSHRMAQEIQRQLEELDVKQRELERRGVAVEKALRGEGEAGDTQEEEELLREWFNLMREQSELRRYERELLMRAEELELEDRHTRLQQELRDKMSRDGECLFSLILCNIKKKIKLGFEC
jgi:hypothetical protein